MDGERGGMAWPGWGTILNSVVGEGLSDKVLSEGERGSHVDAWESAVGRGAG